MANTGKKPAAPTAPVGTVARALRMLQELAEANDGVTVAKLGTQMGLPSSTVHRLLQLLRTEGFAESDSASRAYRAGPELHRIAALLVGRRTLATIARPVMERTAAACEETCLLGMYLPYARKMMFAEQVASTHALRFEIALNVQLPVMWGSSGRVMLAYLPEDEVRAILSEEEPSPVTGERIRDHDAYIDTLRQIRSRGYDLTRGEKLADSIGIAAPVFDDANAAVASLTVTLPTVRYRPVQRRELTTLVVEAAAELSAMLGHDRSVG
jgi:DNA-binding IclR family transcriptional regulator